MMYFSIESVRIWLEFIIFADKKRIQIKKIADRKASDLFIWFISVLSGDQAVDVLPRCPGGTVGPCERETFGPHLQLFCRYVQTGLFGQMTDDVQIRVFVRPAE